MHNPESVLQNETHKPLWDFETKTDHLIPARRLDLMIVKEKEKAKKKDFCRLGTPQSKMDLA